VSTVRGVEDSGVGRAMSQKERHLVWWKKARGRQGELQPPVEGVLSGGCAATFGLANLGQLGPEMAAFVSLVKAQCRRRRVPFCSQWWYACIYVRLVHCTLRMADH